MTDRELLEWAARAAGIEGKWMTKGDGDLWLFRNDFVDPWNPLTDGQDAFDLSTKLEICIDHDFIEVATYEYQGHIEGEYKKGVRAWIVPVDGTSAGKTIECSELYNSDRFAATRRAIVRAAAELGRSIEK